MYYCMQYFKNLLLSKNSQLSVLLTVFVINCGFVQAQSRGITLEPVNPASSLSFTKGYYRALIIGNNNYQDTTGSWPSLKTALTDARAIQKILKNNYGFTDIKVLENATRRDVIMELEALSKRVLIDDHILIYYAGHGYMDTDSGKGYWVPVDAVGSDRTTFLRNSTIRDEMTTLATRSKHTLLISDSCFSGTMLRSDNRGSRVTESNSERYYKKVLDKKSVQIMSAGGAEYVDDNYKSSGHSPFTYFLLNELKNNDRKMLTVSELSNNVKKAVAYNVDQVPESGVLQGAGDELGEFVFIKVSVSVDGVPRDKVKVEVNVTDATKNKKLKRIFAPLPTL